MKTKIAGFMCSLNPALHKYLFLLQESNENLTKAIQTKELRTSALELEICSLKESLSERLLQMRNLQVNCIRYT